MQEKNMGHICPIGCSGVKQVIYRSAYQLLTLQHIIFTVVVLITGCGSYVCEQGWCPSVTRGSQEPACGCHTGTYTGRGRCQ